MPLPLIALALLSVSAAQPLTDRSADLLPLAVTNGRTMDSELADLDGDTDLDLVLASEFGQNAVLYWDGGRFVHAPSAITQGKRHDTEDIAVADFDGDTRPDIVFVAEDDQTNELYLNAGDGTFRDESARLTLTGVSNAVLALDIDTDGDIDLLIGNNGPNFLLLNDGNANFTDASAERLPQQSDITQDIEAADLNGDGHLDLVFANEGSNRVLINDGKGFFTDETEARIGIRPREETREVAIGDVDGDGDHDLVFANVAWTGSDPRDKLLINDGAGKFTESRSFPSDEAFSVDADLADVDRDGDLDIVTANIGPGANVPIRVYLNDGKGSFTNATSDFAPPTGFIHGIDVECADLNGDGAIDFYIANHVSYDAILLGATAE